MTNPQANPFMDWNGDAKQPPPQPLPSSAERALRRLFRRFAGQPFKLEQVNSAAAGDVSGAELRAAMPALLRRGDIRAVRKAWGEKLYYLPLDRLLQLQHVWRYSGLKPLAGGPASLRREAKAGLAFDLFRALSYIAANGLKLTAKGTIHQKELGKLTGRLQLDERDVAGLGLKYPHADVYSPQLAIVLDLLQALGLIAKERAAWRLNDGALAAWLALDVPAMNRVLLRHALQRYVPTEPGLAHVVLRLAAPDLQAGEWYSFEELLGTLLDQGMLAATFSKERQDWIGSWLAACAGFGWMDLGENPEDGLMFRWRIGRDELASFHEGGSGEAAGKVIVQPDFEILVPPDVPFSVRFELEACCEHVATDVMSVYRLTRASVAGASRYGRTPEEVSAFLAGHAAFVPETVLNALEQWGREIGRTSLAEVLLLRCADAEAADRIASLSMLHGAVERIGPLDFIVPAGREAEVRKALEGERLAPPVRSSGETKLDYPRLTGQGSAPADASGFGWLEGMGGQGWIYQGTDLHFYEPDDELPEGEQLFPGLRELPPMWWKELRAYHHSTARQIFAQAEAWQTRVALQIGGETLLCLPLELRGDEEWSVKVRALPSPSGRGQDEGREMWLSPGDWRAMRLIVPEIAR
ncbi:helicase-associated domain-containing protein [Paenibacillus sp. TH7-28]